MTESALISAREDDFLHVISHDLREPARMVGQFLKLLKIKSENQIDKDSIEYLDYAISASNRMDQMIKSLAQINQVDSCQQEKTEIDLSALVARIMEKRKSIIRAKDALVTITGENLITERTKVVKEIIDELLMNSLQHAKSSEQLRININCMKIEGKLHICVEDSGTELNNFWLEKAFEPFKKQDKNSKNLGLGLTRLKILVGKFDGEIYIDTTMEGNTSVNCVLS